MIRSLRHQKEICPNIRVFSDPSPPPPKEGKLYSLLCLLLPLCSDHCLHALSPAQCIPANTRPTLCLQTHVQRSIPALLKTNQHLEAAAAQLQVREGPIRTLLRQTA